jgi:hypothetical protein
MTSEKTAPKTRLEWLLVVLSSVAFLASCVACEWQLVESGAHATAGGRAWLVALGVVVASVLFVGPVVCLLAWFGGEETEA